MVMQKRIDEKQHEVTQLTAMLEQVKLVVIVKMIRIYEIHQLELGLRCEKTRQDKCRERKRDARQ